MAKDIEGYLRELQAALAPAGADPALVQDALFDAEEYLRAEMAVGGVVGRGTATYESRFAAVSEAYGTPEEVAAAYLGMKPAAAVASDAVHVAGAAAAPQAPVPPQAAVPPQAPAQPQAPVPPYYGPTPPGVQAGRAAAAAGGVTVPGAWRRVFGVFVDPAVYKAMVYMILSLATGTTYFTLVVTGVSTAGGMLVMIIGIPLFLLVLGMVRAMALFESRLVEGLLGTRMPRRERATPPDMGILERILFWVKDGRTWASMAYMIAMLPAGVFYFTVTVTGLSAGFGLLAAPAWVWLGDWTFVWHGVTYQWWFPAWGIPIAVILGVAVLLGTMHLIRVLGRAHALFAKSMLVRLAK